MLTKHVNCSTILINKATAAYSANDLTQGISDKVPVTGNYTLKVLLNKYFNLKMR